MTGIERQAIRAALERHGGIQTQAAAELGISERVLRYKMKSMAWRGAPNPDPFRQWDQPPPW